MRGLPRRADLSRIIAVRSVGPVAAVLVVTGCGPIEFLATVPLDAAGAIGEAKHIEGDRFAPYEMTAAEQYIHKSRELAGYARFHSAVTFGRKAAEQAQKAKRIALDKAAQPDDRNESTPAGTGGNSPGGTETGPATDVHTNERPGKVIVVPPQGGQ